METDLIKEYIIGNGRTVNDKTVVVFFVDEENWQEYIFGEIMFYSYRNIGFPEHIHLKCLWTLEDLPMSNRTKRINLPVYDAETKQALKEHWLKKTGIIIN